MVAELKQHQIQEVTEFQYLTIHARKNVFNPQRFFFQKQKWRHNHIRLFNAYRLRLRKVLNVWRKLFQQ